MNQGKSAAKPTENIIPKPQNLLLKLSQPKRARRLIFEKICFEPTLHTFTTIQSEERPHVVVLFPKKNHVPALQQPSATTYWLQK